MLVCLLWLVCWVGCGWVFGWCRLLCDLWVVFGWCCWCVYVVFCCWSVCSWCCWVFVFVGIWVWFDGFSWWFCLDVCWGGFWYVVIVIFVGLVILVVVVLGCYDVLGLCLFFICGFSVGYWCLVLGLIWLGILLCWNWCCLCWWLLFVYWLGDFGLVCWDSWVCVDFCCWESVFCVVWYWWLVLFCWIVWK